MILPKGNMIYENLNSSFTNFAELLTDLRANQTTGYVLISFWDYEGVLFLDSGNIINAIEESEDKRNTGQGAIDTLLAKAKEKDGSISVYSLAPDLVMMLAGAVDGEIVYKELTSDFTNFENLIKKLKIEQQTGYIEVLTKDRNSTATIFIRAGEPVESILSTDGKTVSETGIHPKVYEVVNSSGAIFNVYKSGLTTNGSNIAANFDVSQLLKFWGDVIVYVENKFDGDDFNSAFKKALIAKADDYPFLDPFAAEFSYSDGKIKFAGNVTSNFSKGIAAVLRDVFSKISDSNISLEIGNIKKLHRETIEQYSLEDELNNLLK